MINILPEFLSLGYQHNNPMKARYFHLPQNTLLLPEMRFVEWHVFAAAIWLQDSERKDGYK